jgi:two-component system CheB/CheR fusion protein
VATKKTKAGTTPAIPEAATFAIVGLGASAGGLEAFEQFFRNMPVDSGLAFVLVQHLDPEHASLLTEILQRTTTMPVLEALDQVKVTPNHVYVIPPNRDLAIFHGVLQLSVPEAPRGQRMPIDAFLRSLAEDQGENAIGVILSGTGTDGTLGLRAILGAGGVTLVQEPGSAKYDGMPVSAIQAGYATHVQPAEKMPNALMAILHHLPIPKQSVDDSASATATDQTTSSAASPSTAASGMNRILMLLRTATGHDFSQYKKSTIGRRIERRMSQHDLADTEVYARYLKEHPAEVDILFKELLINVTSFFRDPEAFVTLKADILPRLFADKPEDYVFRVWVAGCASGEEAYSIAILLREFMDETQQQFKIQLYATDLDDDAIATARTGLYPPNIAQDVSPERLRRFFVKDDTGYRVKKEIREMVVFAIQNVIKDPPFTRLDLLSCRNLMIYLEGELQNRLLPAFHYALKPGGVLFLSPSESIGNHPDLYQPISRKWKFYRALHSISSTRALMASGLAWASENNNKSPGETVTKTRETNFADLTQRALLHSFAPASVVTDMKGNILFVHGETGKYLRPPPGQATLNVVEMAREGLQLQLRTAVHNAATQEGAGTSRDLCIKHQGDSQAVILSVRPLPNPEGNQKLLLISFQDMDCAIPEKPVRSKRTAVTEERRRIEELERELAYAKENLNGTIEEQQASNEELKSANEELETSKEELQSVNEELITVNAELQAKIEQLAGMQNDMKNLLDNINIGTLFLDLNLHIRRFTREATRVYRLVATDVGRPLSDIKSDLAGEEDLLAHAHTVLDSLAPFEREIHTLGGACYLARIQPYRTLDNVIDGVVLTFTDISKRLEAETAVQAARELAEGIVDTVREPLLVLDGEMKVISASHSFYQYFQVNAAGTLGRSIYALGDGQWDIPDLRVLLEKVLRQDQNFEDYKIEHDFPALGHLTMRLNARRIVSKTGSPQLILLAMEAASG